MIREEEIKYASKDYVNYLLDKQEYHNENYTEDDIRQAFEEGAKWADKTMIEKACKWLEQHQEDYNVYDAWRGDYINFTSLIIDFRKAMKD